MWQTNIAMKDAQQWGEWIREGQDCQSHMIKNYKCSSIQIMKLANYYAGFGALLFHTHLFLETSGLEYQVCPACRSEPYYAF